MCLGVWVVGLVICFRFGTVFGVLTVVWGLRVDVLCFSVALVLVARFGILFTLLLCWWCHFALTYRS